MKRTGTVTLHRDEGTYVAAFTHYPGHPGSWYRRNGDPGDPPEPDEIEYSSIKINGVEIEDVSDELAYALDMKVYEEEE